MNKSGQIDKLTTEGTGNPDGDLNGTPAYTVSTTCAAIGDWLFEKDTGAPVVPGDLLLIEEGDAIPADARLIEPYS